MAALDLTITNSVHSNTELRPHLSMSSTFMPIDHSIDKVPPVTQKVVTCRSNPEIKKRLKKGKKVPKTNKMFECPVCRKRLSYLSSLKRHRDTVCGDNRKSSDPDKKFTCINCGRKRYKSSGSLTRHQKLECGVEPKFGCVLCEVKFHQKCSLKRHLKTQHPDENSFDKFAKVDQQQHCSGMNHSPYGSDYSSVVSR